MRSNAQVDPAPAPAAHEPPHWSGIAIWVFFTALAAAVVFAYRPAWKGDPIWDDDAHMTRPDLRGQEGLRRIWLELGATQQYYPLLHTAFWVQHKLWGDAPLGYHLVNIALHFSAALLVWLILRRLNIPGAWLAAGIFALHPVHVESVAWITELKNTLSAVFYLSAMLAYLKFDTTRRWPWYALAFALFTLGLLCKTVISTLPAGLLVIFWWQRGKLSLRRDFVPLLPWFALGIAAGLFTAHVERNVLLARGAEDPLTIVERFLFAGRAPWFYIEKLSWPANLTFIYPRWHINPSDWRQYLALSATLGLLIGCWMVRHRWRGPLAAVLFFGGTLFPVLGFFNVYPFRYSYVADHFQYLASLGLITLAVGTAAGQLTKRPRWLQTVGVLVGIMILAVFGGLTYRQSKMYANAEQLYQTTIARNPNCWMAYNNLGELRNRDERYDEAKQFFQTAQQLNPNAAEVRNNVGVVRERDRLPEEAILQYELALQADPNYLPAHTNLGRLLLRKGQFQSAIGHLQLVMERKPDADICGNLAIALHETGQRDKAVAYFQQAVALAPHDAAAYNNLAVMLLRQGRLSEATTNFEKALTIKPDYPEARQGLSEALLRQRSNPNETAN